MNPARHDILSDIASRLREMDEIDHVVRELLQKVKKLTRHREELKCLNTLDHILLKDLEDGTD